MQVVLHVLAKPSLRKSLREAIIADLEKWDYGLDVTSEKKRGRTNGWAKIKASCDVPCCGAINIQWDNISKTLVGRAISKRGNLPNELLGRFVSYLIEKRRKDISSLTIRSV